MTNLKSDGENMPVTSADVPEYLELYAQWRLVDSTTITSAQLALQIPGYCLPKIVDPTRLSLLISGEPFINIEDWKADTKYELPYN
jgi:hypothetical protein